MNIVELMMLLYILFTAPNFVENSILLINEEQFRSQNGLRPAALTEFSNLLVGDSAESLSVGSRRSELSKTNPHLLVDYACPTLHVPEERFNEGLKPLIYQGRQEAGGKLPKAS